MKAVTLISSAMIGLLSTGSVEAKTSLATLVEDAVAQRYHLQQFDEDEFSDEPAAEEEPVEETVEEEDGSEAWDPLQPGGKPMSALGFTHGLLTGLYGPYIQRLRNYDCFSETYTFGTEMLNWYTMFTGFDK